MFQSNLTLASDIERALTRRTTEPQLVRAAATAFRTERCKAGLERLRALLTGHDCELRSLSAALGARVQGDGHYAGLRTVCLSRIRGSEGRSEDFTAEFRPLKAHNRERWLRVALAHLKGIVLPPVELIQVGDDYFVRDGNHRVSVARAFGQESIEALVTVC